MAAKQLTLLMIGNDARLTYLIQRYAERVGYAVLLASELPSSTEVCELQPAALIFASIENLELSQTLITEVASCEIPLLVCSSVNDQVRASELGADYCLVHPLTPDSFLAALRAINLAIAESPNAAEQIDH